MLFSSRAYQASTNVTTNQTASRIGRDDEVLAPVLVVPCGQFHERLPWLADAAVNRGPRRDGVVLFDFRVYAMAKILTKS